jgi:hypothetical protein
MKPRRHDGLEIEEDVEQHLTAWRVQKYAWVCLLLLLIAALAGLLGSGPLSRARQGSIGGPLWLQYERIGRYHAPARLIVRGRGAAVRIGEMELWLSRSFLDHVEMRRIDPEPVSVEQGEGRIVYRLRVAPGVETVTAVIRYEPETFGVVEGEVGVGQLTPLRFRQFCFP